MNENIKEKISALADGELSEFEVRRVLDEIEKEPDLRNYWDLLQITRRSLINEDLGNIGIDISGRVRRELSGIKPHAVKNYSSYPRYKSYLAATAGLALVFGINFVITPSYTDTDSFSDEASQTIANAIASPEALEKANVLEKRLHAKVIAVSAKVKAKENLFHLPRRSADCKS